MGMDISLRIPPSSLSCWSSQKDKKTEIEGVGRSLEEVDDPAHRKQWNQYCSMHKCFGNIRLFEWV